MTVELAEGYFMPLFPFLLQNLSILHKKKWHQNYPHQSVRASGLKQCLIMTWVKVSSEHSRNASFENIETDKECKNQW